MSTWLSNLKLPAVERLKAKYPPALVSEFVWWCSPGTVRMPSPDITDVVILSGANKTVVDDGKETVRLAVDNFERIYWGWQIYRSVTAVSESPRFIVNGIHNQIEEMSNYAQSLGIPDAQIHHIDCGESAHTGIQVELMLNESKWRNGMTVVVSSNYHMPRVIRTVTKHLPPHVFLYSGASSPSIEDFEPVVEGEIDRILRYSAEGKIASSLAGLDTKSLLDIRIWSVL